MMKYLKLKIRLKIYFTYLISLETVNILKKKFDYDQKLELPKSQKKPESEETVYRCQNFNLDPIKTMQEINIDENGMKNRQNVL